MNLKDMFISKEEREIRARMKFNQDRQSFRKYYSELDQTMAEFRKMAVDAERSGNHANAVAATRFVLKLQAMQVKVQGLLQRFEMMHAMQRLTGVMTRFMDACNEMGVDMDHRIDLKDMMKSSVSIDMALNKLGMMTDQMDDVFDIIDGAPIGSGEHRTMNQDEMNAAVEAELNKMMGRDSLVNMPAAPAAAAANPAEAAPADSETEQLKKMMQELNG